MRLNIKIDTQLALQADLKIENQTVVTLNAVVTKDNTRMTQITKNNTLYSNNIDDVMQGILNFNTEVNKAEILLKSTEFNQVINDSIGEGELNEL